MTYAAHRYAKFWATENFQKFLERHREFFTKYGYHYDFFEDETDYFTRAVWLGVKEVCRTSQTDLKLIIDIKNALKNLQITNAASSKPLFFTESTFNSKNIHVAVDGIGDLKFPLESAAIENMIVISSKAKFGKGSQTLQDLNVRNTQVIPASKLKVDINEDSFFALTQEISAGLNIESNCTVVPHLYNMLIYGQDQFFDWHTDTEKTENMVATLIVTLPSSHKGGELVIKHGYEKYTFASSEDSSKIKWIAFYSDCYHKIEKVTEGFRVVLTYNIELKSHDLPFLLSNTEINSTLNKCVEEYFDGSNRPKKLMYLLNHSYSENSLKWHLLKGEDRIRGNALYVIAKKQKLVPCLALVIDEELSVDHPSVASYAKFMSTTKVRFLVGENSETLLVKPSFPLEYGHDREICYTIPSVRLCKNFEYYGKGFSGNEASKRESRYHRACVLLCDASLISSSLTNTKLKSLTPEIIDAVSNLPDIPKKADPELIMPHGIDTSVIDEPLRSAVEKYFSDDTHPNKIVYLLNHDYSKEKIRWNMLKGSDESEAHALYAVAKNLNLDPYLAYIEIKEYCSDAFSSDVISSTVTENHVELLLLVDENNLELKPTFFQFNLVNEGEVCFTMKNKDRSKPIKIDKPSLAETIHYYNRACVILCAKQ